MATENWLWGAPRIHGELLKLGITVSELQGRLDRVLIRLHQPIILAECGHDRDRLGGREGEVVQMSAPALELAVRRRPVRAVPWPQTLTGRRMKALANRLELRLRNLARETECR